MLKNIDLRKAISLAINRQAISDTAMEGMRVPADNIIPPGIAGYEAGRVAVLQVRCEAAKAELAKAGYPNGEGLPEITLSCNSGGGHEASWRWCRLTFKPSVSRQRRSSPSGRRTWRNCRASSTRSGAWVGRGLPDHRQLHVPAVRRAKRRQLRKYNDPAVDEAMQEARATADTDARIKA